MLYRKRAALCFSNHKRVNSSIDICALNPAGGLSFFFPKHTFYSKTLHSAALISLRFPNLSAKLLISSVLRGCNRFLLASAMSASRALSLLFRNLSRSALLVSPAQQRHLSVLSNQCRNPLYGSPIQVKKKFINFGFLLGVRILSVYSRLFDEENFYLSLFLGQLIV